MQTRWIPAVAAMTAAIATAQADPWRAEVAKYESYLARPTLRKRTDGRCYLALTKDPRALELLFKGYAKPEEPVDHNKYLIATIAKNYFGESGDERVFELWRRRHKKPIDAWLWFETLRIGRMKSRRNEILELATGREDEYVRAGALAAAIEHVDTYSMEPDLANWCLLRLDELPSKAIERALWIEAIGSIVLRKRSHVRDEPWKALCRKLIEVTFDDDDTPRRSQVVISRYLAETFKCQNLGFDSYWWLGELDRLPNRSPNSGTTTSVAFAGIRTKGDNIVFVIDASDSMLKPVTDKPVGESGPITGVKKPDPVDKRTVPTADDLDWSRIHTRFDAAREFLRVALGTLEEEQKFAVVLFGDEAIALEATKKLVPAHRNNIGRALKELYAIEAIVPAPPNRPGEPVRGARPYGALRGMTNFHGGLRLAFRMTNSGITKKAEYADDKSMIEGCDTLFVLSDGAPSIDDWYGVDKPEPDDQAGDPESNTPQQKSERMWFDGPYGQIGQKFSFLLDDIERLNLLRRCEIHCVGIGEADNNFLGSVASVGHGQSIRIDSRLESGK